MKRLEALLTYPFYFFRNFENAHPAIQCLVYALFIIGGCMALAKYHGVY